MGSLSASVRCIVRAENESIAASKKNNLNYHYSPHISCDYIPYRACFNRVLLVTWLKNAIFYLCCALITSSLCLVKAVSAVLSQSISRTVFSVPSPMVDVLRLSNGCTRASCSGHHYLPAGTIAYLLCLVSARVKKVAR